MGISLIDSPYLLQTTSESECESTKTISNKFQKILQPVLFSNITRRINAGTRRHKRYMNENLLFDSSIEIIEEDYYPFVNHKSAFRELKECNDPILMNKFFNDPPMPTFDIMNEIKREMKSIHFSQKFNLINPRLRCVIRNNLYKINLMKYYESIIQKAFQNPESKQIYLHINSAFDRMFLHAVAQYWSLNCNTIKRLNKPIVTIIEPSQKLDEKNVPIDPKEMKLYEYVEKLKK
ncbi:hypothetical protein A3Q56_05417 [Intoshia linei]|uniref:R3H domain-containing protein n=1 Tax=Intoshia linei TaxID=1819745 RepID=A0A177AZP7_9BILA|nr:hypothetical protein A3Q56_05417 [Intoshia linei]